MKSQVSLDPVYVSTAIRNGDLSTVRSLFPPGCGHVEMVVGRRGVSAFNLSAIEGQLEILQYLVGIGCNIDRVDTNYYNSAHLASWYGHAHILDYLAVIRPQLFRQSRIPYLPIHIAAYKEHAQAIRSCAPHCNINQKNRDHLTPLRISMVHNHEEGVRTCLDMGAKITNGELYERTSEHIRGMLWREFRWRNRKGYLFLLSRDKLGSGENMKRVPKGVLWEVVSYL